MAEALAVVGLVSAIVQFIEFSTKVVGRLDKFRSKNNEIPLVFRDISVQLPLLMSDLKRTKDNTELHEVDLDTQSSVLTLVQNCHTHVIALDEILRKVLPDVEDSSWRLAKKALLSVRQEDKVHFIAQELRNNVIYLTHHCVSVTAQRNNGGGISSRQVDEQMKMLQWLSSTDSSIYHNRATQQKQQGTGQWLLESDAFSRWKYHSRGLWWLHGIREFAPLRSASVIEAMKEFCKLSRSRVLTYHYIDYNDTPNANVANMLRSLIKQVCVGTDELPKVVQTLCAQHRASGHQPSTPTLISTLQALEATLDLQIYIVIDALDEYPEDQRPELMNTIQSLVGRDFCNTHVLVTSRAENDIKYTIGQLASEVICIEKDEVDPDIGLYVRACLLEDPRLNKLPDRIKQIVELKLGKGAQGMFRWAVCQIDALRSCNKASAIKTALENLPKSLFDTYERTLSSISSNDLADARAIMQWIAFAKRPLALEEVAEAATTQPGLEDIDPDDKLYDPHDVLRICRSLVLLSEEKVFICGKFEVRRIVRFAHASVREYLLSDHITRGSAAGFSLSEKQSHEQLGQCCLSVLLRNGARHQVAPDPEVMPLLRYAAEFWFQHAGQRGGVDEGVITRRDWATEDLATRLFHTSVTVFQNWLTIYDPNIKRGSNRLRGSGPSPLYYAALLGLAGPTRALLDLGYDVSALGGRYGNALVASASKGDVRMVRLLVSRGANVNSFGGLAFGSPLQAACFSGSELIVRLLLNNGALVNTTSEGGKHDTALQVACEYGYVNLVRLLVDSGAEVNARAGGFGYALQAAAFKGHYAVAALLLENGAQVTAQGGHYGSALQAAVASGSLEVTKLLLDAGADPNSQTGGFRDALRAAAWRREQPIFDLLLERGADVDLSIRRLREHLNGSGEPDDQELVGRITAARAEKDSALMELVHSATKRISHIEFEEYNSKRAAHKRSVQLNRSRLKNMVQYVLKQDSDQYQDGSIPKTWLVAEKKQ